MKLNYFTKRLSTVGRFLATTLLCVSAIALVWQGAFFSNTSAMANPAASLIAASDLGDQVKGKASVGAGQTKNFIEDTKNKVKQAANKSANRVDQSTDNGGGVETKANRDAARIEQTADQHAAKTKEAVDQTKNVIERGVDSIKDAFSK